MKTTTMPNTLPRQVCTFIFVSSMIETVHIVCTMLWCTFELISHGSGPIPMACTNYDYNASCSMPINEINHFNTWTTSVKHVSEYCEFSGYAYPYGMAALIITIVFTRVSFERLTRVHNITAKRFGLDIVFVRVLIIIQLLTLTIVCIIYRLYNAQLGSIPSELLQSVTETKTQFTACETGTCQFVLPIYNNATTFEQWKTLDAVDYRVALIVLCSCYLSIAITTMITFGPFLCKVPCEIVHGQRLNEENSLLSLFMYKKVRTIVELREIRSEHYDTNSNSTRKRRA